MTTEEIQKIEAAKNVNASEFVKAVESTDTYLNALKNVKEKNFKTLEGSEKQVTWAAKIRDEKSAEFAFKYTVAQYHATIKPEWYKDQPDKVKKVFSFIASNKATVIIENR